MRVSEKKEAKSTCLPVKKKKRKEVKIVFMPFSFLDFNRVKMWHWLVKVLCLVGYFIIVYKFRYKKYNVIAFDF